MEEERRLAYVGITRAKENLSITSARMRMIRGETQYNKVSRFVEEIPRELLDLGESEPKTEKYRSVEPNPRKAAFARAKAVLREKPMASGRYDQPKNFGSQTTVLDYKEGDRVRHIKFGEGVVTQIISGGRDYEVTVDFDAAGTKKMFAAFAKLKKV